MNSIAFVRVAVSMLFLAGCNSVSTPDSGNGPVVDINDYPMSVLSQELKDSLAYMGNEERLAYDVYNHLYDIHDQSIKQLHNIASKSEIRHIETVQALVKRYQLNENNLTEVASPSVGDHAHVDVENMPAGQYDIPVIQTLYNALITKGEASKQEALEVGCMVEVTDINDLDTYIAQAQNANAEDVEAAFNALREGSYQHYWAFDSGLKSAGVAEGCCSLGMLDGVSYCHSEYPQSSKGNGRGHNR